MEGVDLEGGGPGELPEEGRATGGRAGRGEHRRRGGGCRVLAKRRLLHCIHREQVECNASDQGLDNMANLERETVGMVTSSCEVHSYHFDMTKICNKYQNQQ